MRDVPQPVRERPVRERVRHVPLHLQPGLQAGRHRRKLHGSVIVIVNNSNAWFSIATYYYQRMNQNALQFIFTSTDQHIPQVEMLSLQTLHQNIFNGPLARYLSLLDEVRKSRVKHLSHG